MDRENVFAKGFLRTQSIDPAILFSILGGLVVAIGLVMFLTYRYQKWRRYQAFVEEMQQLGLNTEQEGTFEDLVKRYRMNDPVQVLYSLRMFDEMASREMDRILASPGSLNAKEEFINALYEIREKTYFGSEETPESEFQTAGDTLT